MENKTCNDTQERGKPKKFTQLGRMGHSLHKKKDGSDKYHPRACLTSPIHAKVRPFPSNKQIMVGSSLNELNSRPLTREDPES